VTIQSGSVVQAAGEAFLRTVVAVEGDRARCERFGANKQPAWFAIADLREEKPRAPLRPVF